MRRCESMRAGEIIGVARFHFWSIPDRGISRTCLCPDDLDTVIKPLSPATVFLPGIQEFHPDHRAAAGKISALLEQRRGRTDVWYYEVSRQAEANRLIDITDTLQEKVRAIECFESQLEALDYRDVVLSLNRARSYTLPREMTHAEGFWASENGEGGCSKITRRFHSYLAGPQGSLSGCLEPAQEGLVSIVVRSVNRPELKDALESIAAQSYTPIEVVAVDALGTGELDLRALDGHVHGRLVSDRCGLSRPAAANAGLKSIRGEYFAFLDEDDYLEQEHIERLVSCLQASKAEVAYSGVKCVNSDRTASGMILGEAFDRFRLMWANYIPNNALLFRQSVLNKGLYFDETLECYEDWDFLLQAAQHFEFRFTGLATACYRAGGSSGVGVQSPDPDRVQQARCRVLNKWKHLWPDKLFFEFLNHLAAGHEIEMPGPAPETLDMKNELQDLKTRLRQAKDVQRELIEGYENSKSWRITAPLRFLSSLARRVYR